MHNNQRIPQFGIIYKSLQPSILNIENNKVSILNRKEQHICVRWVPQCSQFIMYNKTNFASFKYLNKTKKN
jgi:hypothetical protein